MAYIDVALANAWTDKDRFNLTAIDVNLENQIASQVIERASQAFDTSLWVNTATTPTIIKSIIAMMYVGRSGQARTQDNINGVDNYWTKLVEDAMRLLESVIRGELVLRDEDGETIPVISAGAIYGEPGESDGLRRRSERPLDDRLCGRGRRHAER